MPTDHTILQQLPGLVLWKDLNSVYLGGNDATAKQSGYRHANDLAGLTDYDIKCKAAERADIYIQKDKKVMQENTCYQDIGVDYYAHDELKVLYATKKPLKDRHHNVIGIITLIQTIKNTRLLNAFFHAVNFEKHANKPKAGLYELQETYPNFSLTKRETMILYYFLKGNTAKQTAQILNISHRTVEQHMDRIKGKMHCANKSQIFEQAYINGFKSILPINIMMSIISNQNNEART